ncbi:Fibronectin/fibrinogen-binding protein [Candidatus Arthromitus sp. SFB-2]|nr:Fibronectin/fibrinogen-binding protein [Candidatus Arthromitus sp. SFB-2]
MIKKIFLLIFLLTLFFLPNLSVSATISNNENVFNNDNMQEIIKENEKEISNLYDYIINMKDDIEILKDLDPKEYVKSLMSHGNEKMSIGKTIFKNITSFIINSVIQKSSKKISIFKSAIKDSENKDKFKLYGNLISSNIYMLKGGEDHIIAQNYFSKELEEIKIPLNPKINASQNIEYYYKKFKKLKKSEEINLNNILACEKEIDYLNSVLLNLDNIQNNNDIDDIRIELGQSGYLKVIKTKNKDNIIKSSPHHYITSNGISIFVGKNNIQNESLTFKISKKDYIWFHVKNIAGSHVILAHNNPNDKLIEIASMLAAFYSKASSSSNVPIDYTKVKNVKKMPHAKPGMVIYTSYNTAYVTPPKDINELNLTIKS